MATRLSPEKASRSLFYIIGQDACRLGQFPVYIEKVRQQLVAGDGGHRSVPTDSKPSGFRNSPTKGLLRLWEGLNA